MTDNKNVFWLNDPTVLYKNGNYAVIIPTNDMTRVEQLNAISRLCIYLIIILLIFGLANYSLCIVILLIILIALYYIYQNDPNGKQKELISKRQTIDENFEQNNQITDLKSKIDYELQSGYYDADGNLVIGKEYSVHTPMDKELIYTTDELLDYQQATCRRPTPDNPFMNPTITDFNTSTPAVACNSDDEDIKEEINRSFNQGLYMDLNDLFNVKNSQRMWYTVPMPAIPPDTIALAKWLWKQPETCKNSSQYCLRYSDLRFER